MFDNKKLVLQREILELQLEWNAELHTQERLEELVKLTEQKNNLKNVLSTIRKKNQTLLTSLDDKPTSPSPEWESYNCAQDYVLSPEFPPSPK